MKSLRSFFATTSSAPSSTRLPPTSLRPSLQLSATRKEYWKMSSGAVVGTMSTASCEPLAASNAASFCSSEFCCPAVRVPVRSVTRAASFGIGCGSCAAAGRAAPRRSVSAIGAAQRRPASARRLIGSLFGGWGRRLRAGRRGSAGVEVDLRRRGDLLLVGDREVRLHRETKHLGGEIHRERAHGDVVVLHRLNVAVASHGDAVLRAFELRLQIGESLVGLQLRVVLGERHQVTERLSELTLRGLILLKELRVVEHLGRHLDGIRAGTRLGHPDEDPLLLGGVALHDLDEVRDEIRAALILVDDLGPGSLDVLVLLLKLVVAAAGNHQHRCTEQRHHPRTHLDSPCPLRGPGLSHGGPAASIQVKKNPRPLGPGVWKGGPSMKGRKSARGFSAIEPSAGYGSRPSPDRNSRPGASATHGWRVPGSAAAAAPPHHSTRSPRRCAPCRCRLQSACSTW